MRYWLDAFTKNYANFSGRARRAEFWMFELFQAIIGIALLLLGSKVSMVFLILSYLFALASIVPGLAMCVRRMHDLDEKGAWLLIGLVPLFGNIWLIVLTCTRGTAGENRYGPDPRAAVAA